VNVTGGAITYAPVAEAHGYTYRALAEIIG